MLEEISQVLIFPTLIWLPLFLIFMRSWAFLWLHLQLWLQNISMLCTAVFRHRKLFFEEGGQGGISSQVHKWQFCVSRVTFDLGHVFGWSLPGYKFPREASCKWVGAHWSVKWHQKTQKWSSIKPPNASQGCLAKKKNELFSSIDLQCTFNSL